MSVTNQPLGKWSFVRVGLIVTGQTEERCLPELFRILVSQGTCNFQVVCRVGQRSPITSKKRKLEMVGSGKTIPDRDAEQIGLPARRFMMSGGDCVILVDDLEFDRLPQVEAVFARYRRALDTMLRADMVGKAAVHFFVNMLEAYYFADADAVNKVLGTDLRDYDGDVENIRHPKNELKALHVAFDEKEHGPLIVRKLNVLHILSRPDACAALRTMFSWTAEATNSTAMWPSGRLFQVTEPQIHALRATR